MSLRTWNIDFNSLIFLTDCILLVLVLNMVQTLKFIFLCFSFVFLVIKAPLLELLLLHFFPFLIHLSDVSLLLFNLFLVKHLHSLFSHFLLSDIPFLLF